MRQKLTETGWKWGKKIICGYIICVRATTSGALAHLLMLGSESINAREGIKTFLVPFPSWPRMSVAAGPSYKYMDHALMFSLGLSFVHPPEFCLNSLVVSCWFGKKYYIRKITFSNIYRGDPMTVWWVLWTLIIKYWSLVLRENNRATQVALGCPIQVYYQCNSPIKARGCSETRSFGSCGKGTRGTGGQNARITNRR